MSRKKNFRGLTSTTNHRFIALLLRWGKKSKSYNVFLNALYHCKQIFDLSIPDVGLHAHSFKTASSVRFANKVSVEQEASQKGTTEITTSKKINEFQSSPIGSRSDQLVALQPNKYSSKKNVRNLTIPLEKATLVKNRISALTSDNHVDTYRGTWNRFRKNLLVFISSPKNTFTSFSGLVCEANTRPGSNRNLEIKVRLRDRKSVV